ncbi:MAG: hypothetical protein RIR79_1649 [Pseudomonadota bacterium]|jgi:hypothetical protein
MRVKSQWFQKGTPKTPQQTASAMAFIAWRVGQNMLKQMRTAHFSIEIGAQYFAFTREVLVFLLLVLDRIAYERMEAQARIEFVTALVRRMAEILQENEDTWLAASPAEEGNRFEQFIDLFNELAPHYGEFNFNANQLPNQLPNQLEGNFEFVRYFGFRMESVMPDKDKRWVTDQLMAIEVPEAVETLSRAIKGILQ